MSLYSIVGEDAPGSPAISDPGDDGALEPYCTECDARAGIFIGLGGDWLHYAGEPEDRDVRPYDPGHAPVIGWRRSPGIVVVAR